MKTTCILIPILALAVASASADTLRLPYRDDPANGAQGAPRPVRGMTMETVRARFGEPEKRLPTVGQPPITRWVYPRFTVYFEGNVTLHAVANKK